MSLPKGGRGKKAPYKTQQMRVPLPIKDDVNKLIAAYRGLIEKHQVINTNDLESLKNEILNLNTALINANQEIEKLNTSLLNTSLSKEKNEPLNLNTDLEKETINLNTDNANNIEANEWITTKEAWKLYGQSIKYDTFRKTSTEQLEKRFGLLGDLSKKENKTYNSKWLIKVKSLLD
jgi:hypothetical protein